ncbi:MAG: 1-acyl-sn-glycerol-3-phosphate acyltransferase [Alphaproteobacteria bacterium]|nr:MAG: 1-acyl-sn-glycerol-3-phosphate acyltransferase [Alphaproteobacteria bacterium]
MDAAAATPKTEPCQGGDRTLTLELRMLRVVAGAAASVVVCYGPQIAVIRMAPRLAPAMPRFIHRVFCRAAGIEVIGVGKPANGSTLFVANHISWLDIPVLGSQLPASFVAKTEVGEMGIMGTLAAMQRTIYVERDARHRSGEQRDRIVERLAAGDNIILFPEGTSTSGNRVLPFKTSLFGVAEQAARYRDEAGGTCDLRIQPVTLAYTHVNDLPLSRAGRYKIAWVGEDEFAPHFRQVMRLGRIRAVLQYHAPVRLADFGSRKALAQHCHAVVAAGLRRANSGRLQGE